MSKNKRNKKENRIWLWACAVIGVLFISFTVLLACAGLKSRALCGNNNKGFYSCHAPIQSGHPDANYTASDKFSPPILKGLIINPRSKTNYFDFLLDKGDGFPSHCHSHESGNPLETETRKLINYFFLGITLPSEDFWVNLNFAQKDRIISPRLGLTDMGRIMLEADLRLKKDTACLTDPRNPVGARYWQIVKEKLNKLGLVNPPIPSGNRVWIVPGEAVVEEEGDSVTIINSSLKVCLESDYLANYENGIARNPSPVIARSPDRVGTTKQSQQLPTRCAEQAMKETILSVLEYKVNHSQAYAPLRQIYNSLILAECYKRKYWGKGSFFSHCVNQCYLDGLRSEKRWNKKDYFNAYVRSVNQGEYIFTRSEYDPYQLDMVQRRYISGGIKLSLQGSHSSPVIARHRVVIPRLVRGIQTQQNPISSPVTSIKDLLLAKFTGTQERQAPWDGNINITLFSSPIQKNGHSPISAEKIGTVIDDINNIEGRIIFDDETKQNIIQKVSKWELGKCLVIGPGRDSDYLPVLLAKLGIETSVLDIDKKAIKEQKELYGRFDLEQQIDTYTAYDELKNETYDCIFVLAVFGMDETAYYEQTFFVLLQKMIPILKHLNLEGGYLFVNMRGLYPSLEECKNNQFIMSPRRFFQFLHRGLDVFGKGRNTDFILQPQININGFSMHPVYLDEERTGVVYKAERIIESEQTTQPPKSSPIEKQPPKTGGIDFTSSSPVKKQVILVVDDEKDVREKCAGILEKEGYRVITAGGEEEAFAIWRQNEVIDLIITDMVMNPRGNGYHLTRRIKEINPNQMVIIQTRMLDDSSQEAINSQFPDVAYVHKDTFPRTIKLVKAKLKERDKKSESSPVEQKTILLVDDDAVMRYGCSLFLKAGGFEVITADSRKEAESILENRRIDLLLTDMRMPDSDEDGLELTRETRKRYPRLPIIIQTFTLNPSLTNRIKSEFSDVLYIPKNPDRILDLINAKLREQTEAESISSPAQTRSPHSERGGIDLHPITPVSSPTFDAGPVLALTDSGHPLYKVSQDFKSAFTATIKYLKNEYSIELPKKLHVFIFGKYADNKQTQASDLDIGIFLEREDRRHWLVEKESYALSQELGRQLIKKGYDPDFEIDVFNNDEKINRTFRQMLANYRKLFTHLPVRHEAGQKYIIDIMPGQEPKRYTLAYYAIRRDAIMREAEFSSPIEDSEQNIDIKTKVVAVKQSFKKQIDILVDIIQANSRIYPSMIEIIKTIDQTNKAEIKQMAKEKILEPFNYNYGGHGINIYHNWEQFLVQEKLQQRPKSSYASHYGPIQLLTMISLNARLHFSNLEDCLEGKSKRDIEILRKAAEENFENAYLLRKILDIIEEKEKVPSPGGIDFTSSADLVPKDVSPKPLILLIEDTLEEQIKYKAELEKRGYEIYIVKNGEDALIYLNGKKDSHSRLPDAVLTDRYLGTGMRGQKVLSAIRREGFTMPLFIHTVDDPYIADRVSLPDGTSVFIEDKNTGYSVKILGEKDGRRQIIALAAMAVYQGEAYVLDGNQGFCIFDIALNERVRPDVSSQTAKFLVATNPLDLDEEIELKGTGVLRESAVYSHATAPLSVLMVLATRKRLYFFDNKGETKGWEYVGKDAEIDDIYIGAHDDIYILDAGQRKIRIYRRETYQSEFIIENKENPLAICSDSADNIYIAYDSGKIERYNHQGILDESWSIGNAGRVISDIEVDEKNNIYVLSGGIGAILKFNPQGKAVELIGKDVLQEPVEIKVADNKIFVLDIARNDILILEPELSSPIETESVERFRPIWEAMHERDKARFEQLRKALEQTGQTWLIAGKGLPEEWDGDEPVPIDNPWNGKLDSQEDLWYQVSDYIKNLKVDFNQEEFAKIENTSINLIDNAKQHNIGGYALLISREIDKQNGQKGIEIVCVEDGREPGKVPFNEQVKRLRSRKHGGQGGFGIYSMKKNNDTLIIFDKRPGQPCKIWSNERPDEERIVDIPWLTPHGRITIARKWVDSVSSPAQPQPPVPEPGGIDLRGMEIIRR